MAITTRTLNPLPFQDLDPHRFEDLVRQIIYDFKIWRSLEPTGRLGSDDGYDARGYEITYDQPEPVEPEIEEAEENIGRRPEDRLWQIQCKREKTITPTKVARYSDEILQEANPIPYGVVFAAPCDFSKKARDKFAEKMRQKGVQEFYLWGKADLEDMLVQPKNDHLLYAYFGISLSIRRRSKKSEISSYLSIKRKAVRHLGDIERHGHKEVLLRDVADVGYPYSAGGADFENRPSWKKYLFCGHYYAGIEILVAKFHAYREIDRETGELAKWDYSEEVNLAKPFDDPWEPKNDNDRNLAYRAYKYCDENFKDSNRAHFELVRRIPYERIVDIDSLGDPIAPCPHIYVEKRSGSFFDEGVYALLRGVNAWSYEHRVTREDNKLRIKKFPDKFPEVKENPLPPTGTQAAEA
ncbi:MAG TPA: hypothetical protein VFO34_08865 [Candidatus Acidoferrales bacterium]|nr:hypothetical protein [Candidatus Acidoferrales bacterium]